MTCHRSTRHFSNIHVLRTLEKSEIHLNVITLTDTDDDEFAMGLTDACGEEYTEDVRVDDPGMRDYLRYHFTENGEPLKLSLTQVDVVPVHRDEKLYTVSRVTWNICTIIIMVIIILMFMLFQRKLNLKH